MPNKRIKLKAKAMNDKKKQSKKSADPPKVMVKVTAERPIKIGHMTCARGALAVLSKQRADALVKDEKAEIIY